MNPILKNILAVITGCLVGSIVNISLVEIGHQILPMGIDTNNMEELAAILPTLSAEYFIFPFLAHALGTLVGALIAAKIAANHKMKFALAIGGLFLLGGIMMTFMLPSPSWFIALDLILAYIPMAYLGGKFVLGKL